MEATHVLVVDDDSSMRAALSESLEICGFEVDAADVDETPLAGEAPDALVCRLCREKAAAVASRHAGRTVLAADTLVVLDGALLGKPADPLEAVAMLSALRDRVHVVYTAVCVMRDGQVETRVSATDVTMRAYTDAEIEAYVETGDPLDKAGAYGIQGMGAFLVDRIEGNLDTVIGLPRLLLDRLATDALHKLGIVTDCK